MYSLRELLADGAAMLVIHDAARLVENLPAALPGDVAEVGVFEIEGREQRVEAAELEKLAPVEGAGAAAAVEARDRDRRSPVVAVAHAQPPSSHQPCVRPVSSRSLLGSLKKIWQETAKTFAIGEAFEQRREEVGRHAHVAVEQHDDVVPGCAEAGVRAAAEAEIRGQRQHLHRGKCLAHELGAAVGRAVVDHDDLRSPDCRESASMTEGRYRSSRSRPFQLGMTTRGGAVVRRVSDGGAVRPSEQLPAEVGHGRARQR